jgi:hypothetical protein
VRLLDAALAASLSTAAAAAAPPPCAAIARHVDEASRGSEGPLFLRSYEAGPDEAALPPPLATSAFSYDNALAIIALSACGDVRRARRIADAFVWVATHDRTFADGRVRNAYRAGPVARGAALLPGWWDSKQNLWAEDRYQDGSQTGNAAWVALALLTLDRMDADPEYRRTAERLAGWIADQTADARPPHGFSGGVDGFDTAQTRLPWRSTEHNVDVAALGSWLMVSGSPDLGRRLRDPSRKFLDAMFDRKLGMFRLGTNPEGGTQPPDRVALDALIWPLVGVADAPADWNRSLSYSDAHLAVPGGFDFNQDRDGLWTEGTMQAALVEGLKGDSSRQAALLDVSKRLTAPSGYLYATGVGRITTGIPIGPDSKSDDFFYFHRPHLGATAWAVLAEQSFNPFTGRRRENVPLTR